MKAGRKPTIPRPYKNKKGQPVTRDHGHADRLREKRLTVGTLNALIIAHEADPRHDVANLRRLKRRYREQKYQLDVMRP